MSGDEPLHPNIKNVRAKLRAGRIGKQDLESFEKWVNNPKKVTPGSPVEAQALELLAECRAAVEESGGPSAASGEHADAAPAAKLGGAFHNPYTFIPFPSSFPERKEPTPLTADELEPERRTGWIDIELRTLSPLLSCAPAEGGPGEHGVLKALAIGDDVIVPATGVRGALRSMLSVIVGGTLSYIDEGIWLTQGRDMQIPTPRKGDTDAPGPHLVRVLEPGSSERPGRVELGETKLIPVESIEQAAASAGLHNISPFRPTNGRPKESLWCDGFPPGRCSTSRPEGASWQVRLSGKPVGGTKREAIFKGSGEVVELAPELWEAYEGRHRHAAVPELRRGDLVWVELENPGASVSAANVRSLQWARWGRWGVRLIDLIKDKHRGFVPDSMNEDGLVDQVTDLFGQIPHRSAPKAAGPFAARVRPENLVFRDALQEKVERAVALAPLVAPHPGCAAFYRREADPGKVANDDRTPLRGYKVYRTTMERGREAPWRFDAQGVYGDDGGLLDSRQKVNRTADLLEEGVEGRLRITFRALTESELALLMAACTVDWRLGGGKPLGLGHCRVTRARAFDESGENIHDLETHGEGPMRLPDEIGQSLKPALLKRLEQWQESQKPVERLRYPRAVDRNGNRIHRGGHVWFRRHAEMTKPKGAGEVAEKPGLMVLGTAGSLEAKLGKDKVRGQPLPVFDPEHSKADRLFGYDLIGEEAPWEGRGQKKKRRFTSLEPFDPGKHVSGEERSGGNQSQSRDSRDRGRRSRD